ncbi:MAG: serine/threonine protein kinase, partial [Spirulina sp. DLM2.Bin59]
MIAQLLNNRYRILQPLGSGGFGDTFLAEDTNLPSQRRCVIKTLRPVQQNSQIYQLVKDRFQREAVILEELGNDHPQIPTLYAYFESDNAFHLVQEWIEGESLEQRRQRGERLSDSAVRSLLTELLPVLDFIHQRQIVHRDIKPDNIILRAKGGQPVLIDFGAVKETMGTVLNSAGRSTSSIVIGTPGFMPQEQAVGRPVFASDLFSLGLTAIALLCGCHPSELTTDPLTGEIVWRDRAPMVSPTLANVLDVAIRSHARDRYPTAQAMLQALQGQAIPPTTTSPPPTPSFTPPPPPKNRFLPPP